MKKVLFIVAIAIFSTGVLVTSCSNEDSPLNCTQLAVDYSNAVSAYSIDQSATNCNDLKSAIDDYLDSDCALLTDELRTSLEHERTALICE